MGETPENGRETADLRRSAGMTEDGINGWFVREVLPLEAALMQFLRRSWPNKSDIDDLAQEVYARVYEAAREKINHAKKIRDDAAKRAADSVDAIINHDSLKDGFWDTLFAAFQTGVDARLTPPAFMHTWVTVDRIEDIIPALNSQRAEEVDERKVRSVT